jgi:rhodanese-related sulfurtransferase
MSRAMILRAGVIALVTAALGFALPTIARAESCTPGPEAATAEPASTIAAVVPANKRTKANLYLSSQDAGPLIAEHAKEILFVDVRTRGELMFAGMPVAVDAHVPFWLDPAPRSFDAEKGSFALAVNPHFVADIDKLLAAKGLTRDAPVVLICQGGGRAARAADLLFAAGFTQPWVIVDGFEGDPVAEGPNKGMRTVNGWRNAGLAWTTKLDPAKMYRGD